MSKPSDKKGHVEADVPRAFYTVREFAAAACLAVDTVYRLMKRDKLAWVRIGGEKRIPVTEVQRLTDEAMGRVAS